jgi:hypothetical protein
MISFRRVFMLVSMVVVVVLFSFNALAEDKKYDNQVRVLFHTGLQFQEKVGLSAHFIPGVNLLKGFSPLMYLNVDWSPNPYVTISPVIGCDFTNKEVIVAIQIAPRYKKFYAWINFEIQPQSLFVYWFGQIQYKVLPWLHIGLEEESSGNFHEPKKMSHGSGPNILFRFTDYAGVDIAFHARKQDGDIYGELLARLHLFFFGKLKVPEPKSS